MHEPDSPGSVDDDEVDSVRFEGNTIVGGMTNIGITFDPPDDWECRDNTVDDSFAIRFSDSRANRLVTRQTD